MSQRGNVIGTPDECTEMPRDWSDVPPDVCRGGGMEDNIRDLSVLMRGMQMSGGAWRGVDLSSVFDEE